MKIYIRIICIGLFSLFSLAGFSQSTVTFNYTGTIQTWTVPDGVTSINIKALGAQGGNENWGGITYSGGLGANMSGDFTVTPGQVLKILVGQQGQTKSVGGGGGGSFVATSTDIPLVVAGGGGGASSDMNGVGGVTITSGTDDSQGYVSGGTSGNGGSVCGENRNDGGAGGGFFTNGADANSGGNGGFGGKAFVNGGTAGLGGRLDLACEDADGGFGGGGGTTCNTVGGGGGGGYSGGAGGHHFNNCGPDDGIRAGGGGGGSFNSGVNPINIAGVNTGHGEVIITLLTSCPEITVDVTPYALDCFGYDYQLTINPIGGVAPYTITASGGTLSATEINGNPVQADTYVFLFDGFQTATFTTTITVVDADGCESGAIEVELTNPELVVAGSAVSTPASCPDAADGTITYSGQSGGTPHVNNPNFPDGWVYYLLGPQGEIQQGSPTFTGLAPGFYDVGAGDASGCGTGSFSIEVLNGDNEAPTISCADVSVDADVNCEASVTLTAPIGDDNCSVVSVVGVRSDALALTDAYPLGTTTVTWTVTDSASLTASCTQNVIVTDTTAPTITCSADITVNNDPGECGAVVTFAEPTATDNCSIGVHVLNPGELFYDYLDNVAYSQGSPGLPLTFNPTEGNYMGVFLQNGGSTHMMYQDVTMPSAGPIMLDFDLQYESHTTLNVLSQFVAIEIRNVTTNAVLETLFKTMPGDPLSTPMTHYNFDLSAYANQNIRFCFINATINNFFFDVLYDAITIPGSSLVNGSFETGDYTGWNLSQSSSSGRSGTFGIGSGPPTTVNQTTGLASGSTFPVGTTTNTFEVTDLSGNPATCSFDVTVTDNEAPTITCPDSITVVSDPGTCSASLVLQSPNVIDNCGGLAQASLSLNGDTIFDYIFVDTMGGGLDQPRPLIFGPDGNLYVSNAGANWSTDSSILRYDGSTGAFMDEFVSPGSLQFPRGLVFGSDGNLYVASYFANEVLRYDGTTGALINSFVPAGGNLVRPTGLTFGPGDDLYVAQAASNNILRYDGATGAYEGVFATTASSFNIGLKFGPDGNLYVANLGANTIIRFDGATGAYIDDFVASGGGGLLVPEALDFAADGNLYVTSFSNGKVLSYDGSTGAFLNEVSASGIGLSAPDGLTFGPDGHLYVSNTGLDQIVRYPTGELEIPGGINEITYSGSDGSGNSASCSYTITVTNIVPYNDPVTEGIIPSSIDPIQAGTGFSLSADFNDDNLTAATWYFSNDGGFAVGSIAEAESEFTTPGTISGGVVSGTFNFNADQTGVYAVKVVVEDACGVTAEATYDYVVIYDPSGGFVTGGGWIDSPVGALVGTDYKGKANFGLVAKYKTGNNNVTLEGNTNFQFKEGDFHFKSNIYSEMSLVISGERKATYKGSGTVNGSGNYDFRVIVIDGEAPGAGPDDYDSFRIKIWTSGSPDDVVYDNEIGVVENADSSTELGGGQIVIHKPKGNNKASAAVSTEKPTAEDVFDGFELVSWPNPAKEYFNILLKSKNNVDQISIQVYDLNGRMVASITGEPNKEYRIGTSFQAGLYFINVTQGSEAKQIKLIKY